MALISTRRFEMGIDYVQPVYGLDAFNCPHSECGAFAHQEWYYSVTAMARATGGNQSRVKGFSVSICARCEKVALWEESQMIYPRVYTTPPASEDMPLEVKKHYDEARAIFSQSPRGAAAILRLAIQKLTIELGEEGDNLNKAIGNLVKKGLSERIQKSLDIVRVIGNNAVHPGQIVIEDNIGVAMSLFKITNLIVEDIITKSKDIDELYNNLPAEVKDQITKRDN
jgi:hypothetical protein